MLRGVDSTMFMRSGDWLLESLEAGRDLAILDLRADAAFRKGHIKGSVRMALNELPDRIAALPPRTQEVVCVCNGAIQSAMAVVFLRALGFEKAFNLTGGMSSWERQGRPLETSPHAGASPAPPAQQALVP